MKSQTSCGETYLSTSMMVSNLWAMVSTVLRPPPNSSRIVFWIIASVSKSTLLVASSSKRMRDLRTRALKCTQKGKKSIEKE